MPEGVRRTWAREVFSRSFLALVATQFFVSLNDNMFRWLVVPIGTKLFGGREALAVSLGAACFILPFLFLPPRPATWPIASAREAS